MLDSGVTSSRPYSPENQAMDRHNDHCFVIVNSQRGGPSTGLPTKTEQSDLYQQCTAETAGTNASYSCRVL